MIPYTQLQAHAQQQVFIAAPMTQQQFLQAWQQMTPAMRNCITTANLDNVVYKACDDWGFDSFTNRCKIFAYDRTDGDFTMYTLERKHHVICKIRTTFQSSMQHVLQYPAARWHGPLYSIRKDAINTNPTGLRVMYDPNSYFAQSQLKDRWNGQTAPYTIGLRVTPQTDLTAGMHGQGNAQAQQAAAQQAAAQQAAAQQAAAQQQQPQPAQNPAVSFEQVKQEVFGANEHTKMLGKLFKFRPAANGITLEFKMLGVSPTGINTTNPQEVQIMLMGLGIWNITQQFVQRLQANQFNVLGISITYVSQADEMIRYLQ